MKNIFTSLILGLMLVSNFAEARSAYQVYRMPAAGNIPGYGAIDLSQSAARTGILPNANTTATSANTNSAIVARDASGNFSASTITAALTGNASTASALAANPVDCNPGDFAIAIAANGDLTCATPAGSGDVVGPAASIDGEIVLFNSTTGKLIKRATGTGVVHATSGVFSVGNVALASEVSGTLPNGNTTATSANTNSAIVARDGSGNFSATTITAALTGNASTATALAANPADCSAGQFATTIAANGDLTCATPAGAPGTTAIAASSINWALTPVYTKTLSANTTFTFTGATTGQTIIVRLTNTASNYTVTWPTVKWPGGTPPVMTIGAKDDVYTFVYDGSTYYGSYVQDMF